MWKCGRAELATDDNMVHVHCIAWVPTATNTHSECVILFYFYGNSGYANAPQCYVARTLPVCCL